MMSTAGSPLVVFSRIIPVPGGQSSACAAKLVFTSTTAISTKVDISFDLNTGTYHYQPSFVGLSIRLSFKGTPRRSYKNTRTVGKALSDDAKLMKLFEEWPADHGRVYTTQEAKMQRFNIFKTQAKEIYAHNKVKDRSYDQGLKKFADTTYDPQR